MRVIHHYDADSTVVVLNTLYNVGARDEQADKTGFAHLFEHLMFGGSKNIAEYDKAVENAGGSNNAFTNNDYTNYYITVPAENIETAFWLESDRMMMLDFSQKSLDVQKGVVVEEFRQRYYNAPFGELWHHLRGLLYKTHPYRWPTIGLEIGHIETASLQDVEAFFYKHYHPANAVLCVAGNVSLEETTALCEKWYGGIDRSGEINKNIYPTEPRPVARQLLETTDLSPNRAVFIAWRGPEFADHRSLELELFADMLGASEISPLYLQLVKKDHLFNAAECFYLRGLSEGMFVLYGILNDDISHADAEKALMHVMYEAIHGAELTETQLDMAKNKVTTSLLFEKATLINKAQKLCFYENLGQLQEMDKEPETYRKPSLDEIRKTAAATLNPEIASVIYYSPK